MGDRDTPCATCGKWTHRLSPGGSGILYCNDSCRQGILPVRDTPCMFCGKWTHRLTPGGKGKVSCGCKKKSA